MQKPEKLAVNLRVAAEMLSIGYPQRPEVGPPPGLAAVTKHSSPDITDLKLREFLDLSALVA